MSRRRDMPRGRCRSWLESSSRKLRSARLARLEHNRVARVSSKSGIGNRERVPIMSDVRANTGRKLRGRTTVDRCCLLVMELGGRWPTWMAPPRASRVLVQNGQETANAFASRVVRAIAAVCRDEQTLETVVIAAGWAKDHEQVLVARSRITQAVAKAMDGGPGRSYCRLTTSCPRKPDMSCSRPRVPWRCSSPVRRSRSACASTRIPLWFGLRRGGGPTPCRFRARPERLPLSSAALPPRSAV